jgi:hypothetical protein
MPQYRLTWRRCSRRPAEKPDGRRLRPCASEKLCAENCRERTVRCPRQTVHERGLIRQRYCRAETASEKGAPSSPTAPASSRSSMAPWCGDCHGSAAKLSAKCTPGSFETPPEPRCVGQDRRIGCHRALAPHDSNEGCPVHRAFAGFAAAERALVYPGSLESPEGSGCAFPRRTWRFQRTCSTQACG